MTAPWLSVVMPVYNGEKTLGDTLTSLVGQDQGIEIIAVDQASSDGGRKIIDRIGDRIGIRVVNAPDSTNWMQTTNIGLAEARAPLVTMLHQDDLWLPGRAEALMRLADRCGDAVMWVHAARYIDDRGKTIGRLAPPLGSNPRCLDGHEVLSRLLVQNTFPLPAVMFDREAALAAGGLDEALWYTADWDLWLNLASRGRVGWLPEPLVAFRVHAGSQTMTGSRDTKSFARQLAIPLERHIKSLPAARAARVRSLAEASNALNVSLASSYHGQNPEFRKVLARILGLGPVGWYAFFRDTQIVARLLPRVRLKFSKRSS